MFQKPKLIYINKKEQLYDNTCKIVFVLATTLVVNGELCNVQRYVERFNIKALAHDNINVSINHKLCFSSAVLICDTSLFTMRITMDTGADQRAL